jgi:hypothetical protein
VTRRPLITSLLLLLAGLAAPAAVLANIIGGADERDALTRLGPSLGLSAGEMARIRTVSGYVGCLAPTPSLGSGALFLDNRHVVTAAHTLIDDKGRLRTKCFFKNQERTYFMTDLVMDPSRIALGSPRPKPGSNDDYAIAALAEPVPNGMPFDVADGPPRAGEELITVSGHPAGMEKTVDASEPVVQRCAIRRVPVPGRAGLSTFYRTDCDATGSSSGAMQLTRIGGRLFFRGFVISTGPWQGAAGERLRGEPYNEAAGSVTTALGVDGPVLAAGNRLLGR